MPLGLTGIEKIETKNDMGGVLLTRAIDIRDGRISAPGGDEAAFQQLTLDQPRVFSIYGEELLGPYASHLLFEKHYYTQDDPNSIPRRILDRIVIDDVTGCWVPDYYLNYAGYAGATDNELGMTPSGQSGLHRVTRARQELMDAEDIPLLTPEHDVEHMCRFTSCCNPGHSKRMTSLENNIRKDNAVPLEAALKTGQLAMVGANGHNYAPIAALLEGYRVILSTRFGARELQKLDRDTLMITLASCVAREKRRRLGKKPTKRYEKPNVSDFQEALT
ncbi:MAG TPA: hypothetical protein VFT49_01785 [Candidatus Saccharimonadales bacterium]|nr:hypothetical protein [Candidatus Saccharimonadales bacterium]